MYKYSYDIKQKLEGYKEDIFIETYFFRLIMYAISMIALLPFIGIASCDNWSFSKIPMLLWIIIIFCPSSAIGSWVYSYIIYKKGVRTALYPLKSKKNTAINNYNDTIKKLFKSTLSSYMSIMLVPLLILSILVISTIFADIRNIQVIIILFIIALSLLAVVFLILFIKMFIIDKHSITKPSLNSFIYE